jgi:dTDP-4-dehydrorhamnose 3,5-epimerase
MGAPYVPEAARGVRWDDPAFAIEWPAMPAVISDRDQGYDLVDGSGPDLDR